MGILREIGESIGKKNDYTKNGSMIVFKKGEKYYNKINGKEISEAEVGNRTVITFKNSDTK